MLCSEEERDIHRKVKEAMFKNEYGNLRNLSINMFILSPMMPHSDLRHRKCHQGIYAIKRYSAAAKTNLKINNTPSTV